MTADLRDENEESPMTTSPPGMNTPSDPENDRRVALAAHHLYEAELALHDAHQSHVEAWIAATSDKLHQALLEHLAAIREQDSVAVDERAPQTAPRDKERF